MMNRKSGVNRPKPPLPVRVCAGCEYFVRDALACAVDGEFTGPMSTCPGWQFRQACRACGCSHHDPCPEGCWWVEPDLCSSCAPPPRPVRRKARAA